MGHAGKRPCIYLGGQMAGLPQASVVARRAMLSEALSALGFTVIDPLADEEYGVDTEGVITAAPKYKGGVALADPNEIAWLDLRQLATCDVAFFDFTLAPELPSRGSVAEIGFAVAHNIPVLGWVKPGSWYDYPFVSGLMRYWHWDLSKVLEELRKWG